MCIVLIVLGKKASSDIKKQVFIYVMKKTNKNRLYLRILGNNSSSIQLELRVLSLLFKNFRQNHFVVIEVLNKHHFSDCRLTGLSSCFFTLIISYVSKSFSDVFILKLLKPQKKKDKLKILIRIMKAGIQIKKRGR